MKSQKNIIEKMAVLILILSILSIIPQYKLYNEPESNTDIGFHSFITPPQNDI